MSGHIDFNNSSDALQAAISNIFSNVSNVSANHRNNSNEGGVFSGNGPLHSALGLFLVQAIIIISLARFIHLGLRKLRQPRVIAEILGGICLGPSVLGNIPGFSQIIFPDVGNLNLISNVGLVLYLFLVGLELDPQAFFGDLKRTLSISMAGIAVPFVFGAAVSYGLFNVLLKEHVVPFSSFLLFTGVAMSITAFPVLARILAEFKLLATPVGLISISAAAINDAVAWTMLALVISIVNAGDNTTALYVFLVALAYAILLLIPFRYFFQFIYTRFFSRASELLEQFLIASVFILIFLSAWITELIGIHAIFGAFLVGLVIPRNSNLPMQLTEKVEDLVNIVFLPLFFASSGLRTELNLLDDAETWGFLFLVIVVSCAGKILGCALTARWTGISWRESWTIGFLMNTKGLVELIVLNIGLNAKVINARIFMIMVLMALVTTFMTSPIVSFIYPPKFYNRALEKPKKRVEPKDKQGERPDGETHVLFVISSMDCVSCVANFLQLLRRCFPQSEKLQLNALKLVETSERSSSVMLASQANAAIKADTALKSIHFFGNFLKIKTNCFLTTSSSAEFADEVCNAVNEHACNLLLVPFTDKSSYQTQDIIRKATITTLLVLDQGDEPAPSDNTGAMVGSKLGQKGSILVSFSGGPDDREALSIALKLYSGGPGCVVTVLHLKQIEVAQTKPAANAIVKLAANKIGLGHQNSEGHQDSEEKEDVQAIDRFQQMAKAKPGLSYRRVEAAEMSSIIAHECRMTSFDCVLIGQSSAKIGEEFREDELQPTGFERPSVRKNSSIPKISSSNGLKPMDDNAADGTNDGKRSSMMRKLSSVGLRASTVSNLRSVLVTGRLGAELSRMKVNSTIVIVRKPRLNKISA